MSIYWINSKSSSLALDSALIGGKGLGLFNLLRMNANVPDFGVITTDAYRYYSKHEKLPEGLIEEIYQSFNSWRNFEFLAVRSSMNLEDGLSDSFAGMLSSFLYVDQSNIEKYIIDCFNSAQNPELEAYRQVKKIEQEVSVAVVIQVMINAKISGVAFSRSPVKNSADFLVESCLGLGEGLVAGKVEVDRYVVNRFGTVIEQVVSEKKMMLNYRHESLKVEIEDVDSKRSNVSSLKPTQLEEIIKTIAELERQVNQPIDVEWVYDCYKADKPFIVQMRPITKGFPKISYYVDTNLSESYPGLVSPFTGSIIPILYKNVFTSAAKYLGATKKKLKLLIPHYSNLVKFINGHLYYHLSDYYSALSALSGGEKNIESWHRMIGGKLDNVFIKFDNLSPGKFESISSLGKLIKYIFFGMFTYNSFYKNANKKRLEISYEIKRVSTLKDSIHLLGKILNSDFGFGLTVVNDYLVMTFLKIFEFRLNKAGFSKNEIAKYLRTNLALDSIRPLVELDKMIYHLKDFDDFMQDFELVVNSDNFITYNELYSHLSHYEENVNLLKTYLLKYGDRAFEELKFESLCFSDSPFEFYKFIKWYAHSNQIHSLDLKKNENLPGLGPLNWWIWKKLHYFITQRENARFVRGQFYSLVRKIFFKIIIELRKEQGFENYSRLDFYGLTLRDLLKYTRNELDISDLADIIDSNKQWWMQSEDFPEFLAWDNISKINLVKEEVDYNPEAIKGEPANNINGRGRVLILKTPYDAFEVDDLSDKILVTKNTDPAWVFIMSKCAGLISEKGSLLSHTAIIGRELSLPTIVGVKDATKIFKQDQIIEIDGQTGIIQIIS